MSCLYHYYAMSQDSPGCTTHSDGAIMCHLEISSYEQHQEARIEIAKSIGIEPGKMTLCSLTLLNPSAASKHGVDEVSA